MTEKAKERVKNGRLYIFHTRMAFGDPAPYKTKILKISYLVDGKNAPTGKPYEYECGGGEIKLALP